jgi:ClpP class serine protease
MIVFIFRSVPLTKLMNAVPLSTFGLTGRKVVAVVRECGNILGGTKEGEGRIRAAPLLEKLRKLADDRNVAGIVLRVDSGGKPLSDLLGLDIPGFQGSKG